MKNVLKNLARPMIVCGPSGVGKGTLIGMIMNEYPDCFGFSISHTTRPIRGSEQDCIDYYFVSEEEFRQGVWENEFIEHAFVHNNYYGTSVQAVRDVTENGKICILDIDTQGVEQVYAHPEYDPFIIYLFPPSLEELERRLRGRETDIEEQILLRIKNSVRELEYAEKRRENFDKIVVNDDLDRAYEEFRVTIHEVYNI